MAPFKKDSIHDIAGESPPAYGEYAPPLAIPPLNLSQNAGISCDTTVTQDECVVHLEFLATLADLRETISSTKGLFGIPEPIPELFDQNLNEARARVSEKRWAVYTTRAVERYTTWFNLCVHSSRDPVRLSDFEKSTYDSITDWDLPLRWSQNMLPPLDVLMVWHAHMLNPRAFLEDCIRHGKNSFWVAGFPWQMIHDSISGQDLVYEPGEEARSNFERRTRLQWDNLQDTSEKKVLCPSCANPVSVPWTDGESTVLPGDAWDGWHGFADRHFRAICPTCEFAVDHEKLKIAKFRKDVDALLVSKLPMPGTFYNLRGVPKAFTYLHQRRKVQSSFPNRLVEVTGNGLLRLTDAKLGQCTDVSTIRSYLESQLKNRQTMKQVNSTTLSTTLLPVEKVAFRRMMSRYWDNTSPFALDLVGAVIRQGTFVQKMDNIDWLHSPTVKDTMLRLIRKYVTFFFIMATNPKCMAVPTLDVDLAWHTHQLTPSRYYAYSTYMTRQRCKFQIFIDHDDKVEENALSDGFEWTSKMYKECTDGELYSECTCWYCEAIRASDLSRSRLLVSSTTSRARQAADDLHHRPDISSDPDKNPHISAHSAVRPREDTGTDARQMKFLRLQSDWQKAQRRANKRDGKKPDSKNSAADAGIYAYPLLWGFPVAVPYYAPYMCDPGINSETYAVNPACMNLVAGGHAACAAGTCGGAVAAGSCGGLGGSGACAAGGCGAGGGGGGAGSCGGGGGCGSGGCGGGGGGGGGCGGGGGGGGGC